MTHPSNMGPVARASACLILLAETLLLIGVLVWLVVDLLTAKPTSYASAVALCLVVVIGAVWTAATTVALWKRVQWARSSAIVLQILQISVAVGAFQGLFARADVGWALLVPAVILIGLLLWPTARR